jgi:hypothetical protein
MFWLFGTATAHFVGTPLPFESPQLKPVPKGVNIRSLQNGFSQISTNQTYAAVYFNDTTQPLYIVDKSLDVASMLVGNGLIVRSITELHSFSHPGPLDLQGTRHDSAGSLDTRFLGHPAIGCRWYVFDGFRVHLPPTCLAAAECFATSRLAMFRTIDHTIFAVTLKQVSLAAFTIPLILNISVTFLILLRIHQVERLASTRDGMHHLRFTRRMIITAFESSIILPVYFLVLVILYYTRSQMIEVVSHLFVERVPSPV